MYLEAQVPGFPWTRVCISHYKAAKRWVFQWYCTLLIIIVNIVRKQWRVESRHLQFKRYPSPIQKIQCAIIWSIKWNLQCTIIWKLCSAKLHENLSYCNLNSLPIKLLNWNVFNESVVDSKLTLHVKFSKGSLSFSFVVLRVTSATKLFFSIK